jgi:hypothetical protein
MVVVIARSRYVEATKTVERPRATAFARPAVMVRSGVFWVPGFESFAPGQDPQT